jgi:hypothetical protein
LRDYCFLVRDSVQYDVYTNASEECVASIIFLEDDSSEFLRNLDKVLLDYTAPHNISEDGSLTSYLSTMKRNYFA